jgi:hypothetical protein
MRSGEGRGRDLPSEGLVVAATVDALVRNNAEQAVFPLIENAT